MGFVLDQQTFVGIIEAFFLVMFVYALAMIASVPVPNSIVGVLGFVLWVLCVLLQYAFVLISLVSFVTAAASGNSLYSDCLVEWAHGYALFNVLAIFAGAFQPFVLSCLSVLNLYTTMLVEAARVWKMAAVGEDAGGEVSFGSALLLSLFHSAWPLFNFVVFFGSASFIFSICWIPSAFFMFGSMFLPLVVLGALHHYWAKPIIEDGAQTCLPKPFVELVFNMTAAYHVFGTEFNVCFNGALEEDEASGMIIAFPVLFTLLTFTISTLVTSGTYLAFHIYSRNNPPSQELIGELYQFQYDSFTHKPRLYLPIFDMDFSRALESLEKLTQLPNLGWGPENFQQLARSTMTLNALIGIIKCTITVIFFVLANCGWVTPNIGTAKAAAGRKLTAFNNPMHVAKKKEATTV
jgi:hypothetical protein